MNKLLILAGTLICCRVIAAPAPLPKNLSQKLLGKWDVNWSGIPHIIYLANSGKYQARTRYTTYTGTWHVKDDCLFIKEKCLEDADSTWKYYQIKLSPKEYGFDGSFADGEVSLKFGRVK